MENSQLVEAFVASIGIDNEARMRAHEFLESCKSSQGLLPTLVSLVVSEQSLELRQMGAIYLKNTVKTWDDSQRSYVLPGDDKAYLKTNIIHTLRLSLPEKVRSQMEEVVYNIANTDYPWVEAYQQIAVALSASDSDSVYSGLSMLYQVSRAFEFAMSKKRQHLPEIVNQFNSQINTLFGNLLSTLNEDTYKFIALILQTYWAWTYIEVPLQLLTANELGSWIEKIKVVSELKANEPDENLPIWVCKRWAVQTLHRFFYRYFNANYLKENQKPVGQYFQENWAVPVMQIFLPQILNLGTTPDIVTNYLIKYATQAVKFQPTAAIVNTVANQLITGVIMRLLNRVPNDETLWTENPVEYIRREADLGYAYFSPRSACIDLLLALCEHGHLTMFLTYASSQLSPNTPLLEKEALLLAIGSLAHLIKKDQALSKDIEKLLENFVLPEFDNSVGFLRARACWMYAHFAAFPFTNPNHQAVVLQKICLLTKDSELPVKVEAATALPKLLIWENSKEKIGNEIKEVLQIYLGIMNQIDSEELMDALEEVVGKFEEQIVPYALELTQYLQGAFLRMAQSDDRNEGDSSLAAASTMNTISKIVDALEDRAEDLVSISKILYPVLQYSLSIVGCDYFEEGIRLLTSLLYYAPADTLPHLYPLFYDFIRPALVDTSESSPYGLDHTEEVFPVVANFISKYKKQTLEIMNVHSEFIGQLLSSEYQEVIMGCKLCICLMENLQGQIDSLIPGIVSKLIQLISDQSSKSMRLIIMQALCISIWYNPLLALQALDSTGRTTDFFRFCIGSLPTIKDHMAKMHSLFGLSSLFTVAEQLPEVFTSQLHVILGSILKLVAQKSEGKVEALEFKDGPFVDPQKLGPEYERLLERIKQAQQDSGSEDSYLFDNEADDSYDSPFEAKNKREYLKEVLVEMATRAPSIYQNIIALLGEKEKSQVQELIS